MFCAFCLNEQENTEYILGVYWRVKTKVEKGEEKGKTTRFCSGTQKRGKRFEKDKVERKTWAD